MAASFILFVLKKNKELKLYINYKKLNNIIIKNQYPLPNINEFWDWLSGTKIFTKLNIKGVYNLICIKKKEKWKTIFRIQYRLYKYYIILFGLTNVLTLC